MRRLYAIVFDYAIYGRPDLGKGFHVDLGGQQGWKTFWRFRRFVRIWSKVR